MNIGKALREIREKKGLRQEDAARLIGMKQGVLSRLERDGVDPKVGTLERVARGYGIPVEVILFMALEEGDIAEDMREFYSAMKIPIQSLLDKTVFDSDKI